MNDQQRPDRPTSSLPASDDLHALTGAYAVDAVDDDERARFERHLETCAECRDEVASLQVAASQLAHLARMTPPPQLRDRVLSDIAAVRPLPPAVMTRSTATTQVVSRPQVDELQQRRERRRAPRWLAVAAAVVLVGGGATAAITQPWDRGQTPQQTVATRVLDDPAATRHSTEFPGGASAEVVSSASEGKAVIVTRNLPPAPDGRVYQLWFQKGGAFSSAGLMPNEANQVTVLDGAVTGAAAVGITEEPAGGSQQPTTAPLALIPLV